MLQSKSEGIERTINKRKRGSQHSYCLVLLAFCQNWINVRDIKSLSE